MRNILLIIEYDGTNYKGWQKQPDVISVQEKIEQILYKVTKEKIEIFGSGRTDAKVHALGQTANFNTNCTIPAEKIATVLNTYLPDDIAIKESKEVSEDFHARYCAKGKTYKYRILNSPTKKPLEHNYSYHVKPELDLELMEYEAEFLIGKHDFKAFSNTGSSQKTSIRTIDNIKFSRIGDIIEIEFVGSGFLYNMVRIIVGTLVEIGKKSNRYHIQSALETRERSFAGPTAPPQGLFLKKVSYNLDIKN